MIPLTVPDGIVLELFRPMEFTANVCIIISRKIKNVYREEEKYVQNKSFYFYSLQQFQSDILALWE